MATKMILNCLPFYFSAIQIEKKLGRDKKDVPLSEHQYLKRSIMSYIIAYDLFGQERIDIPAELQPNVIRFNEICAEQEIMHDIPLFSTRITHNPPKSVA